ncbi:AGAP003860-PC [Anopheles gambiae str. PEST]|uniref:Proline dehydrogenase n=1 Tax=Anopheles gambiae TaxID=7165 RepID=F5HJD1_ANOGA|nr:AGAP003860-PB [Anopheles gambiae str. PEST]EGK96392.1 AGAP003860-PC [Anopheles gambiae str. PEST]
MAFLRTVSRCNSLVPRKVSSPSSTGTNGCLSHSRSEQFLRQYGIHAASNHRGQLSSALLAALNHRLTLEGHPSLDGTRRWRSTTVAAPSPVSTGARQRQQQDNNPSTPQRDPLDVSFNDPHAAFKSKTTFELIRAYFVLVLMFGDSHEVCGLTFFLNLPQVHYTFVKEYPPAVYFWHTVGVFPMPVTMGPTKHEKQGTRTEQALLRSFGVKPILDYSVEEDLSQEEAEKREVEASVSSAGTNLSEDSADSLPQYSVDKTFADRRYKVQSARTYFYLNEATCERNMETFLECLDAVKGATFGTGITAIKLTALGRPQLLLQVSEVIMQARRYMMDLAGSTGNILTHHKTIQDLERYLGNVSDKAEVKQFLEKVTSDKDGILHLFPWTGIINEDCQLSETFRVPDPVTGQMRRLISKIPPKEEEMFRNMIRRLNTIVKTAQDLDVRIMIDAEQTYFQPAISRITLEMMRKYNTEKAIVFNTYQCYLKDTYKEVCTDLEQAKRQNFYFGAKLVRGAYIEQERARAAALGYEDPTNPSFEATTEMYHKTLTECLRRIRILKDANIDPKKIAIMVASHNEDTVRFAIEKMQEIGIHPEDKVICFGQLLGMCDYITFPLGQAGYSAYKYIPYGPVNEVLPYLSRRAQENKGVLQKIKKEKRLLLSEITKRLAKGQLFYKPKGKYVPI